MPDRPFDDGFPRIKLGTLIHWRLLSCQAQYTRPQIPNSDRTLNSLAHLGLVKILLFDYRKLSVYGKVKFWAHWADSKLYVYRITGPF